MKLQTIKGKNKPFKIKTTWLLKTARVILWTLIIFLVFRGIGTMFNSSEAGEAQRVVNTFVEERSYRDRVELEASAFAESFSLDYFTYERGDDYQERLKDYMPSQMSVQNPGHGSIKALSAISYGVEWYSENQLNVKVEVKVRYRITSNDEGDSITEIEDNIFIAVPIMEKEGRYIVEDNPVITSRPQKADAGISFYTDSGVDSAVNNEISQVLESFFNTYYSGSAGEISYYIYDNSKIQGLNNRFKLKRLDSVRAFEGESSNEYFVIVELSIEDAISGLNYKQGYHLNLIKENQRYYVKNFNIRTVNLNIQKEED
ncbi:conjugal transfer protein [Alkaliphilus pronyensis]|uniref:conjugal transfer protein n=1 Tax=Alkaliphilus pronyensis TaxID=1482732 RepID=UPI001865801F|nr:conjugal transfer protein [Alkaliphilus pronyensis]